MDWNLQDQEQKTWLRLFSPYRMQNIVYVLQVGKEINQRQQRVDSYFISKGHNYQLFFSLFTKNEYKKQAIGSSWPSDMSANVFLRCRHDGLVFV